MLFVAVGPHVSRIPDLLRFWWDGKLPDDHTLWGVPVFWVARLGKGIQIGAGLTVVFDLLTAKWLTEWAARASLHASHRQVLARHLIRSKEIMRDLLDEKSEMEGYILLEYLRPSPPSRVPQGVWLTLDEYEDFYRRTIRQAETEHVCKKSHARPCRMQLEYVRRSVYRLAWEQLSPGERAIIATTETAQATNVSLAIAVAASLFLGSGLAAILLLGQQWMTLTFTSVAAFLWVFVVTVVVVRQTETGSDWMPVQAHWYRAQKRLADLLKEQGKKSPPYLAVKVWALRAFLLGAVLDLLAS